MKLCFATHNSHKLEEVRQILGVQFDVVGLDDIGCVDDILENGMTLEENSLIKASYVKENFGLDCFADDTGLEVPALGGEPGVYSARYAGPEKDNKANIELLMNKLSKETDRSARFRTVITLITGQKHHQFEGIVKGNISENLKGSEGFGYDPIFIPEGHEVTFAEMSSQQKNELSHRGRAMNKLVEFLQKNWTIS